MPLLPPSRHPSLQCQPPQLSLAALTPLQSSTYGVGPQQKSCSVSWVPTNVSGRSKAALPSHDPEMEVDPWNLLEDGTSCPSTASGSHGASGVTGDHANLKACSWLKGAVRVRRTELTYIGSLDDDTWRVYDYFGELWRKLVSPVGTGVNGGNQPWPLALGWLLLV